MGQPLQTRYGASFAAKGDGTHAVLAFILIDLDAAVFEVDHQTRPLFEGIGTGLAQFAGWQRSDLLDFSAEFLHDWYALFLTKCAPLFMGESVFPSFFFNALELGHDGKT